MAKHNKLPFVKYKNFKQLFDEGDEAITLSVPDYQRSYTWQSRHRRDLLDDLERLYKLAGANGSEATAQHFCGTVICTPDTSRRYKCYNVVDGQQRLTTLALLHVELSRACDEETFLLDKNLDTFLFEPQSGDRKVFYDLMRGWPANQKETPGQKAYCAAHKQLSYWVAKLTDKKMQASYRRLVEDQLQFIFFVLSDDKEVSKVFETINNRGKALTQLDLVKNHLIYLGELYDWRDFDVTNRWKAVETAAAATHFVGQEDVDTVLRAVVTAMFNPGRRKAGETAYKIVSSYLQTDQDRPLAKLFLTALVSGFKTFKALRASHDASQNNVTKQLTYLNHQPSIAGMLPLILVRELVRKESENETPVLEVIEKANFRLYILENGSKRSDSYNRQLHDLAFQYYWSEQLRRGEKPPEEFAARVKKDNFFLNRDGNLTEETIRNVLLDKIENLVHQNTKGARQIVEALTLDDDEKFNFYHWDGLRYFLARYEEDLRNNQSINWAAMRVGYRESKSNDYLAFEHIYASESDKSLKDYKNALQLRRLGNFVLLPQGVNSSLSKHDVSKKISEMNEKTKGVQLLLQVDELPGIHSMALNFRDFMEKREDSDFGNVNRRIFKKPTKKKNGLVAEAKTFCDLREENMIDFALRTWALQDESFSGIFKGMFSFRHSGEVYISSDETPANKRSKNYIVKEPEKHRVAELLEKRDKVIKS